jgi:hypothetical protein
MTIFVGIGPFKDNRHNFFFVEMRMIEKVSLRRLGDEDKILCLLCRILFSNTLLKCIFKYFVYYIYIPFHMMCINLLICNVYYCQKTQYE